MEKWHWTALLLCIYGFFKEFRPSEPFMTKFLIDYKNLTRTEIVQEAFPVSTYTVFVTLPIVFLITDLLRYRIIIVIEAICNAGVFLLFIFGKDLFALQVGQFIYGVGASAEVGYFAYIYAQVDRVHYKKLTSYTYSATFLGNLMAAIIAQILVSTQWMNISELNYLSLGGTSIAVALSFFLPSVRESLYFNRLDDGKSNLPSKSVAQKAGRAYKLLWTDFKSSYKNTHVLKWSVWWAIATAGNLQVMIYYQSMLDAVDPNGEENEVYNGAINAIQWSLSIVISILVAHSNVQWRKHGELYLTLISFVQAGALIAFSQMTQLIPAYILYMVYKIQYHVMITVAGGEVAQNIPEECQGLIFGINTFVAAGLQAIITAIVSSESGLALDIRPSFTIYGAYFGALGVGFLIISIINCTKKR